MSNRKIWKVGKFEIETLRFPNQGYGWFPHKNGRGPTAVLNSRGSRFGAGWNYRLGVSVGDSTVMIDLLFGIIIIRKVKNEHI